MTAAKFPIDRRPFAMIANYGGLYDQTDSGQPKWMVDPGGVQEIIDKRILPLYEMGYRKMILHLPAGTPRRDRLMTSCQWGYLPDYRKEEFNTVMRDFLHEYQDIDMGVYFGFMIYPYDIDSPLMPETGEDAVVAPDLDIKSHREWYAHNIGSYIDIGFNWFVADYATNSVLAPRAIKISHYLNSSGIEFGGEALPTERLKDSSWIMREEIDEMPWHCMQFYANIRDPEYQWKFDEDTTQVGCIISGHSEQNGDYVINKEDMIRRAEQGFILGTMSNASSEKAQWAFDVGMEYYKKWLDKDYDCPDSSMKELRFESLEELYNEKR